MLKRRDLILAGGAAALASPAVAQSGPWPNKPVRVVVAFNAGGGIDIMTRIVCQELTRKFGVPFVVENRPGASGNIGTAMVARAEPDGYTLSAISIGNVAFNMQLFNSLGYDPDKDLSYVMGLWELPNFLIVPTAHVPATNMAEFLAWARSRPRGSINFATPGSGSTVNLTGATFAQKAGFEATSVSASDAQAIQLLLRGDIHYVTNQLPPFSDLIQEGRLRVLAVADRQRWAALPNVPTMAEAGIPDLAVASWHMLGGPAGLPREIIDRLGAEVRQILADEALKQRLAGLGARVLASSPADVQARLVRERPIWAEMVRTSGARAE